MGDSVSRQFQKTDIEIEQAVAAFVRKIESISRKREAVAPSYVIENLLLELCEEMTKLIDTPLLVDIMGPAVMKLSNAMADFRDSRNEERGFRGAVSRE